MSTRPDRTGPAARHTPEDTPDLLGIRLAHRLMRRDLHRLTATAEAIGGGAACSDRRAAALARWIDLVCEEIHDHHTAEDAVAWPVIAAHAGAHVDLTELSDDHAGLDPIMAGVRTAALAVVAARVDREGAAAALADRLRVLRDEIDEHLDAEEETVFPVIERYVPGSEWRRVEAAIQKGGPGIRFVLPRIVGVTEPAELRTIRRSAGPALSLLMLVLGPGHRRRERLVFG